ncbi:unnamed protein product [Choristocarpus tenellus]
MRSTEIRSTSSPLNPGIDLTARRTDEEELDQRYKPYRTILGKIMFLAGMTRPHLSNNSDWGNDTASRRSVTGYLILINGAPVAWKSKIQGAVTTSSSEAKWTAMVHGMRHAIFLRGMLGQLGILKRVRVWYGDNRGAIQAAVTEGLNGRTRHIDIKLKCTREYVSKGFITVKYIPTTLQLADIMTKRLRKKQVEDFCRHYVD